MGKYFKAHPYISALLGLVGLGVVASSIQEVGTAMSGVFVQLGLCGQENYICKLSYWGLIIFIFAIFAILLDYFSSHRTSKNTLINETVIHERKEKAPPKITTVLTELNEDGIELACIQIIANDDVHCVAKIESIFKLSKRGGLQKVEEKNLVNKLNPRGDFLLWLRNLHDYSDLKKDIPDSITTVTSHGSIARLGFKWEGSDNHRLDGERYQIGVRIYRKEDKLTDMGLVTGILRIKSETGDYGRAMKKLQWEQEVER